jgi:hypothetical protein
MIRQPGAPAGGRYDTAGTTPAPQATANTNTTGYRDPRAGRVWAVRITPASGSTTGWAPSRSCSTYAGSECRSELVSTAARGLRLSTQTSGECRQRRPSSPTWDHPTSIAGRVITSRLPCLPESLFADMLAVVVLDGPNGPGVTSPRHRSRRHRRIRRHRRSRHCRRPGRRRPGVPRPGVPHLGGRRSNPGRIRVRRSRRRRRARRR